MPPSRSARNRIIAKPSHVIAPVFKLPVNVNEKSDSSSSDDIERALTLALEEDDAADDVFGNPASQANDGPAANAVLGSPRPAPLPMPAPPFGGRNFIDISSDTESDVMDVCKSPSSDQDTVMLDPQSSPVANNALRRTRVLHPLLDSPTKPYRRTTGGKRRTENRAPFLDSPAKTQNGSRRTFHLPRARSNRGRNRGQLGRSSEAEAQWADAKEAYGISAADLECKRAERGVADAEYKLARAQSHAELCSAEVWQRRADALQRSIRAIHTEVSSLRRVAQEVQSDLVDAAGSDHEDEIEVPHELNNSSFSSNFFGEASD